MLTKIGGQQCLPAFLDSKMMLFIDHKFYKYLQTRKKNASLTK